MIPMMSEEQKKILHRRWLIVGIITVIGITYLHLWLIVWGFVLLILMLAGLAWFIRWITGADLTGGDGSYHQPSNEEETMWDIYTFDQIFNHDHKD